MKRIYTVEDAVYSQKPAKVQTLQEHVIEPVEITNEVKENGIKVLVDEIRLEENCNKMKMRINKDEFKSLFGPNAKPRKGDYLSLVKAQKKFKVKKAKKFTAKKAKGYNLTLKKMD